MTKVEGHQEVTQKKKEWQFALHKLQIFLVVINLITNQILNNLRFLKI